MQFSTKIISATDSVITVRFNESSTNDFAKLTMHLTAGSWPSCSKHHSPKELVKRSTRLVF